MPASVGAELPGVPANFSLVEGGPLYRLAATLGLVRAPWGPFGLAAVLTLATWGPLLILSAVDGHVLDGGVRVPFWLSLSTHARFLVAIPLLFAAEASIDPRLRNVIGQLVQSRVVSTDALPTLEAAIRALCRWRNAVLPEVLILGMVIALVAAGARVDVLSGLSSWQTVDAGQAARPTLAGWWYAWVALPVFQFLLWRWGWRVLLWSLFLWRFACLPLRLVPTHPDRCGGLAALGRAQGSFAMLSVATSSVFAAVFAEQLFFIGGRLDSLVLPVFGIVLLNLMLFLGPLVPFSAQLVAAKRRGLSEYGVLAADYTRGFDRKWIRRPAGGEEPLLGTSDLQSLADLANSFDIVRQMRGALFGRGLATSIATAALAPMVPLVLFEFPLEHLALKLVKLLLGV